jgi:hypothetical protein
VRARAAGCAATSTSQARRRPASKPLVGQARVVPAVQSRRDEHPVEPAGAAVDVGVLQPHVDRADHGDLGEQQLASAQHQQRAAGHGHRQEEVDLKGLVAMQTVEPSDAQKRLTRQIAAITA